MLRLNSQRQHLLFLRMMMEVVGLIQALEKYLIDLKEEMDWTNSIFTFTD